MLRRIITDPDTLRQAIYTKAMAAVKSNFPIVGPDFTANLIDLHVEDKDITYAQQKKVLLSKGNISAGVYADIDVVDNKTKEVVKHLKKHRILNLPYFTNRYTFILDGNEYSVVNQLRIKSGCYTRKKGNDTLESSFNLAKGANFKLLMDPSTGIFKIDILHATLPMYVLLKVLGATDGEIKTKLGDKLYATNSVVSQTKINNVINTLFEKLVLYKTHATGDVSNVDKINKIKDYFAGTEMDPKTTEITLGKAYSKVDYNIILDAALKILRVYNSEDDIDERDSLEFQTVHSVDDFVHEVLTKNKLEIGKLRSKLTQANIDKLGDVLSPIYFTKPLRKFITNSSISRLPQQINPMEMMDHSALVSKMGEGAIQSMDAVPDSTRQVSPSMIGVIDPISTPESEKVGIDVRFTLSAVKDDNNELYRELIDAKTNERKFLKVIDTYGKYIGLPEDKGEEINALYKSKFVKVPKSKVDYYIPSVHNLSTLTTSTIPFVNSVQGNRAIMGSKFVTQAMPLIHREARLVSTSFGEYDHLSGTSAEQAMVSFLNRKSPVDGRVTKIDDEFIHIKDKEGTVHKLDYISNMPLAVKTMLNSTVLVQPWDNVKKGDTIAESNFTKDDKMALGVNMKVAYVPYHGLNHESGMVISESAAKKLTSEHAYKKTLQITKLLTVDKEKFISAFPTKFTVTQLKKIDSTGIAQPGIIVNYGDPLILVLEDAADSKVNLVLGLVHKSLQGRYRDTSEVYDEHEPGEILDVLKAGNNITILVKVLKPAVLGDKIAGSYGNKGVISKILADSDMLHDNDGKPMDVLISPADVVGRINPAQILETALGKVADKTGKPYNIENFALKNNLDFVKQELKKHDVSDTETLKDPITGKVIPKIFTGKQYMYKLFKTTDSNFAARGVDGPYDQDEAPSGSGESGPKAMGNMEVNAIMGHNARNLLKESTMLRGSKNAEYWRAFQYGGFPVEPVEKKTFTKFVSILKQAGVNVKKQGDTFVAGPLTDKDVLDMSSGEIKESTRLDSKLQPEPGGLFDHVVTGGLNGTKWAHVKLAEPVINPVFENCVKSLLGVETKDVRNMFVEHGGDYIKSRLNSLDVKKEIDATKKMMDNPKIKGDILDKYVKKYKYLKALDETNTRPSDAYMLSVVPVTPPCIRPITIGKTGDTMEADSNLLYRDLILQNNSFKKTLGAKHTELLPENRKALYDRVSDLAGMFATSNVAFAKQGVKGALDYIAGDVPKYGYFQRKVIYNKMNMTGRATIAPDQSLGLDEIGLPVDMAWGMYKPFVMRQMLQQGYGALQARQEITDKTDKAKEFLMQELEKRPVLFNRAPTLWKNNIMSAWPKLREGKNLMVNTLWESSNNADFDGDSLLNSIIYRYNRNSSLAVDSDKNCNILGASPTTNEENMMPFNTLIRSSAGLVNLKDFPRVEDTAEVKGTVTHYKVPEGVQVLTVLINGEIAWKDVTAYTVHKNLQIVECKTQSSRTIHCSTDHSLTTLDDELNLVKAQPCVGLSIPRVRNAVIEYSTVAVPSFTNSYGDRIFPEEIQLTYAFGLLNGQFIGDGWINATHNPHWVYWCKDDASFRDSILTTSQSLNIGIKEISFSVRDMPHEYHGSKSFSQKLCIYCPPLAKYFRSYYACGGAAKKNLPSFWPSTPIEFRWGLLAGLIDSDGSVHVSKAVSKKNAQVQINYTTISRALADNIVALAESLDLTATVSFSKITEAGNTSWIVSFSNNSIIKMQANLRLSHSEKREKLSKAEVTPTLVHKYGPPISTARAKELREVLNTYNKAWREKNKHLPEVERHTYQKSVNSMVTIIGEIIRKDKHMSLQTAIDIANRPLPIFEQSPFWSKWRSLVLRDDIQWEVIKSIKPIPELTEAYDITVPPGYTMVTESGLVAWDSVNVHVPVSDEAIEDSKKMLPSQLIYSDKKRNSMLMFPKIEPVVGLYIATENLGHASGQVHRFKTEADAWQAYYKGTLKPTDLVEIG